MFFARFEDTAEQNVTTPQQRLEALKRKIADKQQRQLISDKDTAQQSDEFGTPSKEKGSQNGQHGVKHPKKRRKVSGAGESELVKPKKKKKKFADDTAMQQECIRRNGESEKIEQPVNGKEDDESEPKKKRKKKKKKKHAVEVDVIPSEVSPPDQKCSNKIKDLEAETPCSDNPVVEDTLHKTKKKKKKKKTIPQDENSGSVASEETNTTEPVCGENNESVQAEMDCSETTVEKNSDAVKTDAGDEKEEWTILGRHKTLQKVGHVKRDLPDWIVNCEVVDPDFDNVCTVAEFGLLDECVVDVLRTMEINSLFPGW